MKLISLWHVVRVWVATWRTFPIIAWVRAAAHYREGSYAQAADLYERGLSKHPLHPAHLCARLDFAYCLFRTQRLEEAERQLRYVITHSPGSREAYLRLARLQVWTGQTNEAALTLHRALQRLDADEELVASFVLAVSENDGPTYLIEAAEKAFASLKLTDTLSPRGELARACLQYRKDKSDDARAAIERLASQSPALFDAVLAHAQILLAEGNVLFARRQLRRAMGAASQHPRVLSMLAETYLRSGTMYNAAFGKQLATQACIATNWLSPREMHVLAEAYYHTGDKLAALLTASKAKQAGSGLVGQYAKSHHLDQLIESLTDGPLA